MSGGVQVRNGQFQLALSPFTQGRWSLFKRIRIGNICLNDETDAQLCRVKKWRWDMVVPPPRGQDPQARTKPRERMHFCPSVLLVRRCGQPERLPDRPRRHCALEIVYIAAFRLRSTMHDVSAQTAEPVIPACAESRQEGSASASVPRAGGDHPDSLRSSEADSSS